LLKRAAGNGHGDLITTDWHFTRNIYYKLKIFLRALVGLRLKPRADGNGARGYLQSFSGISSTTICRQQESPPLVMASTPRTAIQLAEVEVETLR
jgi:hypothetical protein